MSQSFCEFRRPAPRWLTAGVVVLAALGAVANGAGLWRLLLAEDDAMARRTNVSLAPLIGQVHALQAVDPLNDPSYAGRSLWLVGPAAVFYVDAPLHYTVVFNRDPWIRYVEDGHSPAEQLAWLRSRNVTHVVFSWSEIERLRATYGFSEVVTRDWAVTLTQAGLRRVGLSSPALDVYAVPNAADAALSDDGAESTDARAAEQVGE